MKHLICKLKTKAAMTAARTRRVLSGSRGDGYIDTASASVRA